MRNFSQWSQVNYKNHRVLAKNMRLESRLLLHAFILAAAAGATATETGRGGGRGVDGGRGGGAPSPPPGPSNCDDVDAKSYEAECSDVIEWHESIDMSLYVESEVCNLQVATGGGNCADYCANQGRVCRHAQDNSGGGCDTGDDMSMHERQDTSENGCLQTWGDQICGCGSLMTTDDGKPVQEIRACEGGTVSITCEVGTIEILDADYGRAHGPDVCPHAATADQACHSVDSVDIVRAECEGKEACEIVASNGIFGDPCGGTHKYLTVNYQCSDGAPSPPPSACDIAALSVAIEASCPRVPPRLLVPKACPPACAAVFLPGWGACGADTQVAGGFGPDAAAAFDRFLLVCQRGGGGKGGAPLAGGGH